MLKWYLQPEFCILLCSTAAPELSSFPVCVPALSQLGAATGWVDNVAAAEPLLEHARTFSWLHTNTGLRSNININTVPGERGHWVFSDFSEPKAW